VHLAQSVNDSGSATILVVVLLVSGLATGGFTAWLASQKGRGALAWFFLGFFFSLIAILALGFAPSVEDPPPSQDRQRRESADYLEREAMRAKPTEGPGEGSVPWDPRQGAPPD